MEKNYYEILGVEKTATSDEINKAYKKLALKYHPDRYANATDEEKKEAEEKFKEINEAKSILTDDAKRQQYDNFGTVNNHEGFNPFDNWSPFGEETPIVEKGEDIVVHIDISLKESFEGCEKIISFEKKERCGKCNGTGSSDGKKPVCPYCKGTGFEQTIKKTPFGQTIYRRPCSHCNGTGKGKSTTPCEDCNGTGFNVITKKIKIKVPKGVFENATQPLRGMGHESNDIRGINGDLFIVYHIIEDKDFFRSENNIAKVVKLSLLDAWKGTDLTVSNIDGSKYKIKVPPLTEDGWSALLRGKGFENIHNRSRGNFIVIIKYELPKNLSEKQIELLEQFYDLEKSKE